jgi:hypothetical protein
MTETTRATTDGATDSGAGAATGGVACDTCGREFPTDRLLVLHRGVRHPSTLSTAERETYREVYLDEEDQIRSFRLRALVVLVVLYFGFLFLYAGFAG